MSAWLKAAFVPLQDASSETQTCLSQVHTNLPNLLTAQTGLPASITGSWKAAGSSDPQEDPLFVGAAISGESEKVRFGTKVFKSWLIDDKTEDDPLLVGDIDEDPLFVGDEISGESEMQYLMHANDIKPWSAKSLIQPRLAREALVATLTPLRAVKVVDGLHKFTCKLGGVRNLDEFTFVKALLSLLDQNSNVDFIGLVLESMDFKKYETLSVGEWARGLIVFFEGTQEDKEHAIFNLIDQDGDHYLTNEELKEYLKPFVKAMISEEAVALQPWLLHHCTDQIRSSIKSTTCRVIAPSNVDKYGSDMVSFCELFQWLGKTSLVDSLAQIIDTEVSRIHCRI
jgi:hypothetical protein